MKIVANKSLIKKISVALIVIILLNTFIPFYSNADEDEETGGKLFKPVFKMFAAIGDLVIKGLQNIFLGDGDIKGEGIDQLDRDDASFYIRYSPGIIFSGSVPGLDANFISPMEDKDAKRVTGEVHEIERDISIIERESWLKTNYGFDASRLTPIYTETNTGFFNIKDAKAHLEYNWSHDNKSYSLVCTGNLADSDIYKFLMGASMVAAGGGSGTALATILGKLGTDDMDKIKYGDNWTLFERSVTEDPTGTGRKLVSTAGQLQKTLSTWYKGLRLFALVGLLSVLVYVGIRILISSTGQEKSKYKKMIVDWLAAICILFVLQYIMSFTMTIVEKIQGIFTTNVIGLNGQDTLMSNIRQNVNTNYFSGMTSFTNLILYLVLVVYTVVFTIHYLKRLVYLAFFTMIAPLIALTYPLDKIKDGQAQAFGMWVKEYVFNALIPVVHIILYSIFVGSAMELAQSNPLYAIVCIAFLIPAEKFVRKMFGFDKATTSGQLGAAAGGAMIMNAINKIGHKPSKEAEGKQNKVRTTSGGGYLPGGGYSSGGTPPTGGTPLGTNPPLTTPLYGSGLTGGTTPTGAIGRTAPKRNIWNGVKGVGKRYINRNTGKKIRKLARRGLTKAAGAAALGTIGLAAGVASGDLSKVAQYAGGGIMAGSALGGNLGDKAAKLEKQNREAFKKGYLGKDEYLAQQIMKEAWANDDIYKQYGGFLNRKDFNNDAREFINNGIADSNEIVAAMQLKKDHNISNSDAVTIAQLNKRISNGAFGDPTKRAAFEQDIKTSLRNQGFSGDIDKEAARQIRLIGEMKGKLDSLE